MTFAERLRYYREKAGYNQKELAAIVGVTFAAYNKYETNDAQPKIEILVKLAHALDTDVNTLVGFPDVDISFIIHHLETFGINCRIIAPNIVMVDSKELLTDANLSVDELLITIETAQKETDAILSPLKRELYRQRLMYLLFENSYAAMLEALKNQCLEAVTDFAAADPDHQHDKK